MPNWCTNQTFIKIKNFDKEKDLEFFNRVIEAAQTNDECDGLLNFLYPVPKDADTNLCTKVWGTKWEISYALHDIDTTKGVLRIVYDTAWDSPTECFQNAVTRTDDPIWERLQFQTHYLELGCDFAGESTIEKNNSEIFQFEASYIADNHEFSGASDDLIDFVLSFMGDSDEN